MWLNKSEAAVVGKYAAVFIGLSMACGWVGLNRVWSFNFSPQLLVATILVGAMGLAVGYHWAQPLAEQPDKNKLLALLTIREREVLELILKGKSNKEICLALFIEPNTLKTHIKNIYRKTNCTKRNECINLFQS